MDMNITKHEIKITEQGAVRVNESPAIDYHENVKMLHVDLKSKRAQVDLFGTDWCVSEPENTSHIPFVRLSATDETIHLDNSKDKSSVTELSFPDLAGWDIIFADVSRYTLTILFKKTDLE